MNRGKAEALDRNPLYLGDPYLLDRAHSASLIAGSPQCVAIGFLLLLAVAIWVIVAHPSSDCRLSAAASRSRTRKAGCFDATRARLNPS